MSTAKRMFTGIAASLGINLNAKKHNQLETIIDDMVDRYVSAWEQASTEAEQLGLSGKEKDRFINTAIDKVNKQIDTEDSFNPFKRNPQQPPRP